MTYLAIASHHIAASDMTAELLRQAEDRLPSHFVKHSQDVFMLVKAFVSDRKLSQEPLCMYPGCDVQLARDALTRLAKCQAPCNLDAMISQFILHGSSLQPILCCAFQSKALQGTCPMMSSTTLCD